MSKQESTDALIAVVEKALAVSNGQPIPGSFTAQNIGEAIQANLDGYELTKNREYLEKAQQYADTAIEHLWKDGLFVRQKNDIYYEAKLGTGDLLSGLLRLHLVLDDEPASTTVDWSF